MSKKNQNIIKKAVIRSNESEPCPFGLTVPEACNSAGNVVRRMAPLAILGKDATEEELTEVAMANNHLFLWKNPCKRCRYAGKLFEGRDVVECNWDTNVSGTEEKGSLLGSPYYYRHFSGIGIDGLYSFPLGYYTDNSIDRGMYYGMYSLESPGQCNESKNMVKKISETSWRHYVVGNAGQSGVYVRHPHEIKGDMHYYGPFKNAEYAEFFNYLAFCSPKSPNGMEDSKCGILYYDANNKLDKTASGHAEKFCHPGSILFETSPLGIWWQDTYGKVLTNKYVLKIAKESGAKGYKSYREWLLSWCLIDGKPVHSLLY